MAASATLTQPEDIKVVAPDVRTLGTGDMAVLLVGLGFVILPHALRAPAWLTGLTIALYAWRVAAVRYRWMLPGTAALAALAVMGTLGIWLEYRAIFGRTPGIVLLVLFSGLKVLESRNQRDAVAVVFLTWFLAITNLLYSQSIPVALAMVAAVAASVTALVSFAAPRRAPVLNLRTAWTLLWQAVPAALVLFLLFPRVQGPLWGLPQDAYTGMTGLADTMAPGNISQLTLSDAIAFRVEFAGDLPPRRVLYWRGPVLWDFDGRTWRAGSPGLTEPDPAPGGVRVAYSVLLEPHNRNWLFALETPVLLPPRARYLDDGQVISLQPVRARMSYSMTSVVESAPRPEANNDALQRALRLPYGFNPRARALGQSWRDGADDDAAILQRAIAYFRAERLAYTTDPPVLGRDTVDEFLYETRQGFCEHFASSFVFLMRSAGVPARVVTGYQGGDMNPVDGKFTVRQSDAHAWSEVYLQNRGWIRVDPTALSVPGRVDGGLARAVPESAPLPLLMRSDLQWLRGLRYNWEALTHQWNLLVLGYNPERQREFMAWLGRDNADWLDLASILLAVLGTLVGALMLWTFARFARPDPVQAAWDRFCRKLGGRGLARAPHEGPQAYAERAAQRFPSLDAAIRRIGALYISLRYGPPQGGGGPRAPHEDVAELRRLVKDFQFR